MSGRRGSVAFVLALLGAACAPASPAPLGADPIPGRSRGPRPTPSAEPPAPAAPAPPPSSKAPAAPIWAELPIEGYLPAIVVEPSSGEGPRPVVVVTHGAGGRPEPHCARYLEITRGRAFLVCTRGREMDKSLPPDQRGYFYDGHKELGREVVRALDALAARYEARVDPRGAIFAGYSQGASMGLLFLHEKKEHAARFSGGLFVEGGSTDWNIALSARMKEVGLRRVAIVCGRPSCKSDADGVRAYIEKGGLKLEILYAAGAGHTYGGDVAPLVEAAFAWIVEGDPRF